MKAQITVFIIIGLLIVSVFGILIYFMNSIQKSQMQISLEAAGSMLSEGGKYHRYVSSCMEQATREGIELVGMQGGAIYDYQANGSRQYLGPPSYDYGEHVLPYEPDIVLAPVYNVSYAIRKPQFILPNHPDVPFYPYGMTLLVENPKTLDSAFVNMFGNFPRNPFIPLCDWHGENKRSLSEAVACERYDSSNPADHNSVQEYLESFIENRSVECLDFTNLPELSQLDVVIDDITANVTFGNDDIETSIVLPIRIRVSGLDSEIVLKYFNFKHHVRLKKIHELISHIIQKDVNDIFFSMTKDVGTLNDCTEPDGGNALCLKPGMQVTKKTNVCLGKGSCNSDTEYDDVLVVTDDYSLLDGVPYQFQVAIENRIPALDYIRKQAGTGDYDFVVQSGDTIHIAPMGYDPDEDQHNHLGIMSGLYHFRGWNQNQRDIWDDFTCDLALHPDLISDPNCIISSQVLLGKWTSSPEYTTGPNQGRNVSYTTVPTSVSNEDLGVHTLIIEVCDEGGLCDNQPVSIIVVDGAFAAGESPYGSQYAGKSSQEDPYVFHSTVPASVWNTNPEYRWSVKNPTGVEVWTDSTASDIRPIPDSPYDITNIKSKLSSTGMIFQTTGPYQLKVDIYTGSGALDQPGSYNVLDVYQCLPFGTGEPYPYSTGDPFQSNHACCQGTIADDTAPEFGLREPPGTPCFEVVEYGCRNDANFDDYVTGKELGATSALNYLAEPSPVPTDAIYKREFTRVCSGDRGNMCSGAMTDTRTWLETCTECTTCQGTYTTTSAPACVPKAPGTSCGIPTCVLDPNGNNPSVSGPWRCDLSCNSGSCTDTSGCYCDLTCSAVCTGNNKRSYQWSGTDCYSNCNDYLGAGNINCDYDGYAETKCNAPRDVSCTSTVIHGDDYEVCPTDSATRTIDDDYPFFQTYCKNSDWCYYNVECTGEGPKETTGEYCPSAGTVDGDLCYYNSFGSTACDDAGLCNNKADWSSVGMSCADGGPSDGWCVDGEVCYTLACDANAGWNPIPDNCNYASCSTGSVLESGDCVYDIQCTASGWGYGSTDPCPDHKEIMSPHQCWYNPTCDPVNGCEYSDKDPHPGGTVSCTASGWA